MLKHNRRAIGLIAAASVLLGFSACNGGGSSGVAIGGVEVVGTATDAGGNALDEYVTLVFRAQSGAVKSTVTADDGTYRIELDTGTYTLVSSRPGYAETAKGGVVINADRTAPVDVSLDALDPNVYIGSSQCGICHDETYQTFRQTGHPFKLNKVDGAAPVYPFTSLDGVEQRIADDDTAAGDPKAGTDNTLGTPGGWDDITYVIGGFHWKARFIDKNGYIVTGSEVQYNYSTDEMVSYHNDETDKSFSCGNCHTTGWQHFDATVNNRRQDGLPGMDGTFAEQGVGCESCHGAGSTHAQTSMKNDITRVASPRRLSDFEDGTFAFGKAVDCSECHTRDGERDYPDFLSSFDEERMDNGMMPLNAGGRIAAKGGLVRHHEQFDELLGINPDTLDSLRTPGFLLVHGNCLVCHDPHKAGVAAGEPGVTEIGTDPSNANCLRCHSEARFSPQNNVRPQGSMKNLNCVDCHMPKTAKSAVSRTQPNGVLEGDVTSHMFSINLEGPQFTADGKYAYPYLSFDFACRNCHGDEAFDILQVPANFVYHPFN